MNHLGFEVLVILILILANGVFALTELALVSARKHRLRQRADQGHRGAAIALQLANAPNEFLSTVQVGITLIGTLAGAFGGATVAEKLAVRLNAFPRIAPHGEIAAISIVVLAITTLTIILGELVPKRLALTNPEKFAAAMAPVMKGLARLGYPAVRFLGWATDQVLKLFPRPRSETKDTTEEDIRILIDQGRVRGMFAETEQEMVEGVFELGDRRVVEFMQPRRKIVWLDLDGKPEAVTETLLGHSFSRFPVARKDLDQALGYVHVKDLLAQCLSGRPVDLQAGIREFIGMPERMTALEALETFKKAGTHMALVVNEYGGVEGLLTPYDIVESIVGDLSTDGDGAGPSAVHREDGSWLVDGAMPVFEFRELTGVDDLPGEEESSYATLGGLILSQLGRIPSPADHFESGGWRFEVVDMDRNRIDKVLVSRLPDPGALDDPD